jgi:hypothetical protein
VFDDKVHANARADAWLAAQWHARDLLGSTVLTVG